MFFTKKCQSERLLRAKVTHVHVFTYFIQKILLFTSSTEEAFILHSIHFKTLPSAWGSPTLHISINSLWNPCSLNVDILFCFCFCQIHALPFSFLFFFPRRTLLISFFPPTLPLFQLSLTSCRYSRAQKFNCKNLYATFCNWALKGTLIGYYRRHNRLFSNNMLFLLHYQLWQKECRLCPRKPLIIWCNKFNFV